MKTFKFTLTIITIAMVTVVFAGNSSNKNIEDGAKLIVNKIDNDVKLSNNQKNILIKKAKEFLVQNQDSSFTSKELQFQNKKRALMIFNASLDSVCTPEQRTQLVLKREARRQAFIDTYKSNSK